MNAERYIASTLKQSVCLGAGLWVLLAANTVNAEETPRSAMRKGLKAYAAGNLTNAVAWVEKAVPEFPDLAHYNLGNAYYRQAQFEKAADEYNQVLRTTDLSLQAKAYFNRGNALLSQLTTLNEKSQIGVAIQLTFEALDMYEKSIRLDADDMAAKRNYERAQRLRLGLEVELGTWYFNLAESLLGEYKAKDAQTQYINARKQFEHIRTDIDPNHAVTKQYLEQIRQRLEMLALAVEAAEYDLDLALKQIDDYQYMLAAQRLTMTTDERKYAFDLKPELKKKYEETIQKNQEVLRIIEELSNLNTVQ